MTTATVNVWPRLGTTVTLDSGYVITASGAAALLTDEIRRLLAAVRLLTWDPTFVNPSPSPIPQAATGGLTAATATALNDLIVSTEGATCTLTSEGGGLFVWNGASAAPVDNALVCGSATTGRWLRQYDAGYVHVDWFGAVGDGATDDYAAIQAAINASPNVALGAKVYAIGATLTFPRQTTIKGVGQKAGTEIKALSSAMSCCLRVTAGDCIIEDIVFNGNTLTLDAVVLNSSNGTTLRGCDFKSTRRHGLNATTANNNSITIEKCNARFCGTTVTTGTVSTTNGSQLVNFSSALDLTRLEEFGCILVVNGVSPNPMIIEKFNSATQAQVQTATLPTSTAASATYTLYSGNGFNQAYAGVGGNDNNVWAFYDCYAVACAKAGFRINTLYGPMMSNCIVDSSYMGCHIGTLSAINTVTPDGTNLLRFYSEGNVKDIVIENSAGTVITDPVASSLVPVWAPAPIGYNGVVLTQAGRVVSDGRLNEQVNSTTLVLGASEHVVLVQSSGAGNIIVQLPDSGSTSTATFFEKYTVTSADIGGKTVTFKTLSGSTLINGVAGTTGVAVSGNYKRWTATWCQNLTTWVVV